MQGLRIFLICLAASVAAHATVARASTFFISTSTSDVLLKNPTIVIAPNAISTFYVYYQPTNDNAVLGVGHEIISSNPIISRVDYTIDNPTVGGSARWYYAGPYPEGGTYGDATSIVANANAYVVGSTFGTLGATDPLYDSTTGSYRFSVATIQANSVGTTQIRLGVGTQGIAFANSGTNNHIPVNFGFGDAPVYGDDLGSTSTLADATITVMQPDAAHPWHNTNPGMSCDVNADGFVTPTDALTVINALNSKGSGIVLPVPPVAPDTPPPFIDVNGDGILSATDALTVIDYINSQPSTAALSRAESMDFAGAGDNSVSAMPVPEPSTFALAAPAACLLLWLFARRNGRRAAG